MNLFTLTTCAATLIATTAFSDPARYELDPEHTTIGFKVDHLGYAPTLGFFTDIEGSFIYDMDTQDLSDVKVTIGSKSVNSFNTARDRHVKGKDFLDTRKHGNITFTADSGKPSSKTKGKVTGDLTILGNTRPITLNVTLNKAATYPFGHKRFVLGLSLEGSLKRSDFGMNYAVANGLVGNDVKLILETEAMKMD